MTKINNPASPISFQEKIIYGAAHSLSISLSALFVGRQIFRHLPKITPLFHQHKILLLPFGFGCGTAFFATNLITKKAVSMLWREQFKSISEKLETEKHYQNLQNLSFFQLCVFTPIFEELLFRTTLQSILIRSTGIKPGIIGTSILFAATHLLDINPPDPIKSPKDDPIKISINPDFTAHLQTISAIGSGILLGYIRYQFTLTAAIGCHAGIIFSAYCHSSLKSMLKNSSY